MSDKLTLFHQENDGQMSRKASGDWYLREEVDARIATLERELVEAKEKLRIRESQVNIADVRFENMMSRIATLDSQLTAANATIAELRDEASDLRTRLDKRNAQLSECKALGFIDAKEPQ